MEWSNKAKVWFGKGIWGHTAQPTSRAWEFCKSVFWRGNGQSMNTAGGQQIRNLSLQYPPSDCQETLPSSTNNNWMGRGTPEFKPKRYNRKQHLSTQWWSSAHTLPASSPGASLCCHAAGLPATEGIMPKPSLQAWIHKSLSVLTSAFLWPYWQGLRKYLRSWKPEMFLSSPSLKALGLSSTRPQNLLPNSAQSVGLLTQFLCH